MGPAGLESFPPSGRLETGPPWWSSGLLVSSPVPELLPVLEPIPSLVLGTIGWGPPGPRAGTKGLLGGVRRVPALMATVGRREDFPLVFVLDQEWIQGLSK